VVPDVGSLPLALRSSVGAAIPDAIVSMAVTSLTLAQSCLVSTSYKADPSVLCPHRDDFGEVSVLVPFLVPVPDLCTDHI
jgi:hypothetical protein